MMPPWLRQALIGNWASAVIGSVAITGGAWVWSMLTGAYQVLAVAVIMPLAIWAIWRKNSQFAILSACALSAVASTVIIFERVAISYADAPTSTQNIEQKIRKWLDNFKISAQREDDSNAHFFIIATVNNQRIGIVRPKSNDQYVQLRGGVTVSPEHRKAMETLPPQSAEAISRELILELARYKIAFTAVGLPLREIQFFRAVPISGSLTEGEFIRSLDEIDSAALLVKSAFTLLLERSVRSHEAESLKATTQRRNR